MEYLYQRLIHACRRHHHVSPQNQYCILNNAVYIWAKNGLVFDKHKVLQRAYAELFI